MPNVPDFVDTFARVAAKRASWTAVEADDATLTYAQLDRISTRLAQRFIALGVTRGTCVGISLPRGAKVLVALLATLKAGGAYVPLSPSHPAGRLRNIIEDADPQLMVVHPDSPLTEGFAGQILVLDELRAVDDGRPASPLPTPVDPEQLAYVMFTSGSTGRPKGVEVPRGALSNFLVSMAHTPGLTQNDRLLAITTTSFDISGLELFLPLFVGATTVIASLEATRDPRLLRRKLEQGSITTMQATPATWRMLLDAGWRGDGTLRILCGGESMSAALADRLIGVASEVWNMYGPTETTIWSSVQRIEAGYDRITIGRPIDQTQMYVLGEEGEHLGVGCPGEIAIGGRGVARGYRGRPDLTAKRFVDGVYRTGDLGQRLEDGRFEWLGRLDHQVKIRGFRVELGEVEAVLRAVPGVKETLVVADYRDEGDARLVAYWVGEATQADLLTATRGSLAPYMVPAMYVQLDAFPMNTNGKIDRARLPPPATAAGAQIPLRRPESDMEVRVASAWQDVLGLVNVPADQDFFTLGGTSISAVEVLARLQRQLGIEIPLEAFFALPTVEAIAKRVGKKAPPDAPIIVRLRAGASATPLFCLFGIALYQDLADALAGDRPVVAMHVPIRFVPGHEPAPTVDAIAQRYVAHIRAEQARGPYHLLGLCFGGVVAYEVARQLEALGETVESVTVIDAVLPTGVRIDSRLRLRSYVRSFAEVRQAPRRIERWLKRRGDDLRARLSLPSTGANGNGDAGVGAAIDLPIDGPEVDAELRRFASQRARLVSRLLIVRATAEVIPEWMTIEPDHGWGGRASLVVVHDIPADHLGVLREPHVHTLARFVEEPTTATGRESARPPQRRS